MSSCQRGTVYLEGDGPTKFQSGQVIGFLFYVVSQYAQNAFGRVLPGSISAICHDSMDKKGHYHTLWQFTGSFVLVPRNWFFFNLQWLWQYINLHHPLSHLLYTQENIHSHKVSQSYKEENKHMHKSQSYKFKHNYRNKAHCESAILRRNTNSIHTNLHLHVLEYTHRTC